MSERQSSDRFFGVTGKAGAGGQKATFTPRRWAKYMVTPGLIWPEVRDGNFGCEFQSARCFGKEGLRLSLASFSSFGERSAGESGVPRDRPLVQFFCVGPAVALLCLASGGGLNVHVDLGMFRLGSKSVT